MSNFMGVGIWWIGLNRADLGCWRLTSSLIQNSMHKIYAVSLTMNWILTVQVSF